MSELRLETLDNRTAFRPGEPIEGIAGWELSEPPRSVELRLVWRTEGKGDRDVAIVDTIRYDEPAAVDAQIYRLEAPEGPYSFSGKLISLIWSLELVVEPGGRSRRLDVTIAPHGEEVRLGAPASEQPRS